MFLAPLLSLCLLFGLLLPSACLSTHATGSGATISGSLAQGQATGAAASTEYGLAGEWPWNACGRAGTLDGSPLGGAPLDRAACLAARMAGQDAAWLGSIPSDPGWSDPLPIENGDGEEDVRAEAELARQGLELVEQALGDDPGDCRARYLAAWFQYRLARDTGWSDQALVRDLESHALAAASGCPALDGGGPLRLLGRVDLDAPQKPAGLGDAPQAVEHYRAALTLAPGRLENRLGLAEALLAVGDAPLACLEIQELVAAMPPKQELQPAWRRTLELLRGLCFVHTR